MSHPEFKRLLKRRLGKTDSVSEWSQVTAAIFARILLYAVFVLVLQKNFLKYLQRHHYLFFFQIPCHLFSLKGETVSLLSYFHLVPCTSTSTYCLLLHLDYIYFFHTGPALQIIHLMLKASACSNTSNTKQISCSIN